MQKCDLINIETEPMRSIISKLLYQIMKKRGYYVNFKINKFNAVNDEGGVLIQLDLDTMADFEIIKKLCNHLSVLSTIVSGVLKLLCDGIAQKIKYRLIENIIRKNLKEKIKIHINDLKYSKDDGNFMFSLNADIKMKREEIEYFLGMMT